MNRDSDRRKYSILIDGDVVVDHHIYLGCCHHPADGGDGTRILRQDGGAGLTADLLAALCDGEAGLEVCDTRPPDSGEPGMSTNVHQSYATWAPVPAKPGTKKPKVWRVKENIGFGAMMVPAEVEGNPGADCHQEGHDVVVMDEAGLGFRNRPEEWPLEIREMPDSELPWVVLRMSHPICRGELWTRLNQEQRLDRLVVIVSVDDLRRSGAAVTRGLSWEKSVGELLGDLAYHPDIRPIARARHVIVNFGPDGALWVDNSNRKQPRRRFIFDPGHLEGRWEEELDGTVTGAGACLTAGVTRALFDNVQEEIQLTEGVDLGVGIIRGLEAGRALLLAGHGPEDGELPGFPTQEVVSVLKDASDGDLSTVVVPEFAVPASPGSKSQDGPVWSIIVGDPPEGHRPLFGRARKVAVEGEAALSGIPFGRFGKLYTVDRLELKGYNGIRKLMMEYVEKKNPGKPLSLGVFGPPGSGKSFGIKQIAREILGKDTPITTFNLSQFTGPEMLIGALHQIRDEVLKGHVPVAIWDEFDCRDLMWLQYMLAPMNDGEFLEGQVTHPVGKCIFVFAGGTAPSLEEFAKREPGEESREFVSAKGPDFVSRLKGYLNVLGPNPREFDGKVDPGDVGFPIRRAIMLRVMTGRFGSARLDIDKGMLNAMLKVTEFKHGARSMETIIKGTIGNGQRPLAPSNLPPLEQMSLHVDVEQFMALVQENTEFKLQTEDLAPHVHGFYLDLAKKEGWTPEYPMAFEELPDAIKQDNLAAARRIPDVLGLAGLIVVGKNQGSAADPKMVRAIIEANIELLAEAEHDGWMEFKKASGWRLGEKRDDSSKIHPSLKAFNGLRETDKVKDRNAVRHFPEMVERAGFAIQMEGLVTSRT